MFAFAQTAGGTNPMAEVMAQKLGDSPLSPLDLDKVMVWIAARSSGDKAPYCYKHNFGRGAGVPLSDKCAPGLEQNGALCYQQCKAGYAGAGPVCWGKCPEGFSDIGAFCQKPQPYGRGAGYVIWDEGKCNKENPQGCEKNGALWYPKCKPGFHADGCCVCSPDCPAGYNDSGTGCAKPSYARDAGEPFACRAGTERNGLLCYPPCPNNMTAAFGGAGPVCWQRCSAPHQWNCGIGCSNNEETCATVTTDMVLAPINMLTSLITFGLEHYAAAAPTNLATGGAAAVAKGTAQLSKTTKWSLLGTKLVNALEEINTLKEKYYDDPAKVRDMAVLVSDYVNENAGNNFQSISSLTVDNELKSRFGPKGQMYIRKYWALQHLSLIAGWDPKSYTGSQRREKDGIVKGNYDANQWQNASFALGIGSIADPTGIVAVVNAYTHPSCDIPFPADVRLRYKD